MIEFSLTLVFLQEVCLQLTGFHTGSLTRFFHHLDYPEPGKTTVYDTTEKIDLQTVVLNGGVLIKTLELSIDPYLRSQLREEDNSNAVSYEA